MRDRLARGVAQAGMSLQKRSRMWVPRTSLVCIAIPAEQINCPKGKDSTPPWPPSAGVWVPMRSLERYRRGRLWLRLDPSEGVEI